MKTYFLCSQAVIDFARTEEVSKAFKAGYEYDQDDYYVAVLDFNKVEEQYNKLSKDEQYTFWCEEIVGGTMDVSEITLKEIQENGLFYEMEFKTGLTTIKNRAMMIHNLSEKFYCTPIEFINKL